LPYYLLHDNDARQEAVMIAIKMWRQCQKKKVDVRTDFIILKIKRHFFYKLKKALKNSINTYPTGSFDTLSSNKNDLDEVDNKDMLLHIKGKISDDEYNKLIEFFSSNKKAIRPDIKVIIDKIKEILGDQF
jgi:hypothetical protein